VVYLRVLRAWWCRCSCGGRSPGPLEHHPLVFYGFVQSFIYIALAICLHRSQL
jgi:hypothetical protein